MCRRYGVTISGISISVVVEMLKDRCLFQLPNRDCTFIFPQCTTVFTRKYIYALKKSHDRL